MNNLNGQSPSTQKYTLKGIEQAKFDCYTLLIKTDLTIYINQHHNIPVTADVHFYKISKEFGFHILEGNLKEEGDIEYRFDKDLDLILIEYTDPFLMTRDKLVKSSEHEPPLKKT